MTNQSRRRLIGNSALAGLASFFLSVSDTSVTKLIQPEKKLKDFAVILFQGDSITDGNRGRSEDTNHITGFGMAFIRPHPDMN